MAVSIFNGRGLPVPLPGGPFEYGESIVSSTECIPSLIPHVAVWPVCGAQPAGVQFTKTTNMLPNAFIGKAKPPSEDELALELGSRKKLWDELAAILEEELGLEIHEWNSYSPKAGWSLRGKLKKRNIVYLSPHRGCFTASFALGDKALQAARAQGLPAATLRILKEAKKYAEGTAVRITVKTPVDIEAVKKLAMAKLEN